jgi:beta-galactosidase
LYDFDNESHAKIEHAIGQQRDASERAVYQALAERHLSADVRALSSLEKGGDLSAYQIVFFPHAHVLTAEDIVPLSEYVEGGGTLVFGCWSGYRNRNHWCYDAPGKAFLENFVGTRVEDFTVVTPGEVSTMRYAVSNAQAEAPFFNEVLAPVADDITVLASYTSDYYADKPAVSLRHCGRGKVVYFGTFFTLQNVTVLLDALAIEDPLGAWAEIPLEIQVNQRSSESDSLYFLLNFSGESKAMTFRETVFDLLEGRELQGRTEIEPYGIRLVRRE